MDCRDEFLSRFGGKAFSTFEAFSKELQAFEEATGMQYMMKRTCLFNEGTLGREYLVYRYMHYACVRHIRPARRMGQRAGGTRCPAYFSVGTRKHKLFVRQYDMQHNHPAHMEPMVEEPLPVAPLNPSPTSVNPQLEAAVSGCAGGGDDDDVVATVQDCTDDFLRIFLTMSFASFAELQAKMDEFQLATGNRYVKTNTRRLPPGSPGAETLVYSHLVYICYRYGTQVSEAKQRRLQRTAKIGCRSKIYFYSQDNQLHVRRYDFRHNHEVRPDLVHFPPKRRRSRKEKEEEEAAAVVGTATRVGKRLFANGDQRMPPISVFKDDPSRHALGLDSVAMGDEEFEAEDEGEEEVDSLPQIYLQRNGYSQQNLLEDEIPSVFSEHDFENELQHRGQSDQSPGLALPSNPFQMYAHSPSAYPPNNSSFPQSGVDDVEDGDFEDEVAEMASYRPDPRWGLMRSMQKHTRPLDAMLPRLGPHLQRLSELATSCGPVRFASRLRELRALGDKWLRENEILLKRRGFL
ncbi:unnamed protein product [Mesocestoides corti]|nr:unnamed protein product [Mesocestoides corti]